MTTPNFDSLTKATEAIGAIRQVADKLHHSALVAGDAWLVDQACQARAAAAALALNVSDALAALHSEGTT